jgi:hypothetical protein
VQKVRGDAGSTRLPLLHKTPFVLDPRPLWEATSPHAGLLSVSRAYRALGVPELIAAHLLATAGERRQRASESLLALPPVATA